MNVLTEEMYNELLENVNKLQKELAEHEAKCQARHEELLKGQADILAGINDLKQGQMAIIKFIKDSNKN